MHFTDIAKILPGKAERGNLSSSFWLPLFIGTLVTFFSAAFSPALTFATGSQSLAGLGDTFSEIIDRAKPAVVYVQAKKKSGGNTETPAFSGGPGNEQILKEFWGEGGGQSGVSFGFGSGFIYNADGYILTNSHVIRDAVEVTVTLGDKRKFSAKIIGEDRKTDIGLVKIDGKGFPAIPLGDSGQLRSGHWVLAIGSPYEYIQSVTAGIVSATGRHGLGVSDYESFIQTDAAINPGNSGGPLLNIAGEVVGVNTAFLTQTGGYMGIGFAVPVNTARIVAEQLVKDGKVTRAWLGVSLKDAESKHLAAAGLAGTTHAARVVGVAEDSPAHVAGLEPEDLILAINNSPIAGAADLRNRVALSPPDSVASLEYSRQGQRVTVSVTLGTLP
jgi:serine protease Do